jgi:hypothetical protein
MRTIREADWKIFKQVRETALQQFCRQVLDDIDAISRDEALPAHERYLEVYKLIQARDRKLCAGFDGLSRSRAIVQLMFIRKLGLISSDELARFSPEVQQYSTPAE